MTLYQFIALDEMDKQEALWEEGTHLADREKGKYKILLYQIEGFYVEVFYHKEYNVLRGYRPFNSTEQLAPYLEKMQIKV
jgi:hypothetical protein